MEEAVEHLAGEDDVVAHGKIADDAVALAVLGQVADAVLHGRERRGDLHQLAAHLDRAAGHVVRAEDRADGLAAAGAEQARKAVDLALADGEIERAHAGRAGKPGRLIDDLCVLQRVLGAFGLDLRQIVELLAEHLGHELHARQLRDLVLADELAVAQDRDAVADGVDLLEEVRDEDDADAAGLEVEHELKELFDLLLVQRRRRLVEDEHLALHIDRAGDGDHLLHGDGAARQLLRGRGGDAERAEELLRARVHLAPVGKGALGPADI